MADIVLKDRQGVPQTYAGYAKVAFNTPDSGTVIFSEGEATENVPIDLNLADGDQTVTAESGTLIKSAVIKKPTTLTPENVAKDVNVAGVVGTFIGNGVENVEIIPDFSAGDQTVTAEGDTFIKSAIVRKPETLIPDNIAKGVNVAGVTGTLAGALPAVEKDVNFFDYDGTLVASYTVAEMKALEALPDGPEHDGLTFDGWNWTIDEIKSIGRSVNVGAMYITDDGKTRIYITLPEGRTSPYLGLAVNGSVDVDWGDGTAHDVLTGTSTTKAIYTPKHAYASAGDYVITLTITGTANVTGRSLHSYLITAANVDSNASLAYANSIKDVHLGENIGLYNYAFCGCYSLKSITTPSFVTSFGVSTFKACYSLQHITIPSGITSIPNDTFNSCRSLYSVSLNPGITSIGSYAFGDCMALKKIKIPHHVTSIDSYAFVNCYSLTEIDIPGGITDLKPYVFNTCYSLSKVTLNDGLKIIQMNAFLNCYTLAKIRFPASVTGIYQYAFKGIFSVGEIIFDGETPPTASSSESFSNIPTDCVIYVPNDSYLTATNYPSPDKYTYVVGGVSNGNPV